MMAGLKDPAPTMEIPLSSGTATRVSLIANRREGFRLVLGGSAGPVSAGVRARVVVRASPTSREDQAGFVR